MGKQVQRLRGLGLELEAVERARLGWEERRNQPTGNEDKKGLDAPPEIPHCACQQPACLACAFAFFKELQAVAAVEERADRGELQALKEAAYFGQLASVFEAREDARTAALCRRLATRFLNVVRAMADVPLQEVA